MDMREVVFYENNVARVRTRKFRPKKLLYMHAGGDMKKNIMIAILSGLILYAPAQSATYNQQLKQNREMVKSQYSSDIEKKQAILKKMRVFMNEINGRLAKDSTVRVDPPIDIATVTDIQKIDHFHSPQKAQERVFAYIIDDVQSRSDAGSSAKPIGSIKYGERVEVLVQSADMETIQGKTRPWFMVRRDNGDEGWVFGGYLQKKQPAVREGASAKKADKEAEVSIPEVKPLSKETPKSVSAEKFYAYISSDDVRYRSEGTTAAPVLGKLSFGEKVEVLEQSRLKDTIQGKTRPWFLVRRDSGDEGWVFGGYLQKKKPERADESVTAESTAPPSGSASEFMVPTAGKRSSAFGYRVHPVTKKSSSFHSGIDIQAPKGTNVNATADGVVKTASFNKNGYGNLIILEHEKELASYYGHLEKILVREGQRVKKGELLGTVDSTGMSTGNHLHFEIRRGGSALDPDGFLR